jgi:hypothetical protein
MQADHSQVYGGQGLALLPKVENSLAILLAAQKDFAVYEAVALVEVVSAPHSRNLVVQILLPVWLVKVSL